jgi:hypothetical protein
MRLGVRSVNEVICHVSLSSVWFWTLLKLRYRVFPINGHWVSWVIYSEEVPYLTTLQRRAIS